ncbi:MAG TPA: hypothetical protein VFL60_06985 [Gaiellaceae bacterium]|nr:hypothetical protein [Gaiellaceae bacterium]
MRALRLLAVSAALLACCAGVARADVATIVDDGSQPWDGGAAVTTPIEALAGRIASSIAGRTVAVRCESDSDWAALTEPSFLGFVSFWGGRPGDVAELSPDVCRSLESFALATTKPTKCSRTVRVARTSVRVVRRRLIRTTTYVAAARPPAPCFAGGQQLAGDQTFWNGYFADAEALQTLAHEAVHLKGDAVEADAECYGMQAVASVAQQLGDTLDDGRAIAQYYATLLYPQRQTQSPAYWSAECRPGGALDLTPDDGVWP